MSCLKQPRTEKASPIFVHFIVLFRLSVDWMMPGHTGEGYLLYLVFSFKCQSLQKHLYSPSHPEIIFNQLFRHLLSSQVTHKINHQWIERYRDRKDRKKEGKERKGRDKILKITQLRFLSSRHSVKHKSGYLLL